MRRVKSKEIIYVVSGVTGDKNYIQWEVKAFFNEGKAIKLTEELNEKVCKINNKVRIKSLNEILAIPNDIDMGISLDCDYFPEMKELDPNFTINGQVRYYYGECILEE